MWLAATSRCCEQRRTPPVEIAVSHMHAAQRGSLWCPQAVIRVAVLAVGWRTNGGEEARPVTGVAGLTKQLPFVRVTASLQPEGSIVHHGDA